MPGVVEGDKSGVGNQFFHDAGVAQRGGRVVFSPNKKYGALDLRHDGFEVFVDDFDQDVAHRAVDGVVVGRTGFAAIGLDYLSGTFAPDAERE